MDIWVKIEMEYILSNDYDREHEYRNAKHTLFHYINRSRLNFGVEFH